MSGVFIKGGIWTHIHTGRISCEDEGKCRGDSSTSQITRSWQRGMKQILHYNPQKEPIPLTLGFLTFSLQNYEPIRFFWSFKLPQLVALDYCNSRKLLHCVCEMSKITKEEVFCKSANFFHHFSLLCCSCHSTASFFF